MFYKIILKFTFPDEVLLFYFHFYCVLSMLRLYYNFISVLFLRHILWLKGKCENK